MTEDNKFESWARVEVFGHQSYAGLVKQESIGGCSFVRVDVPAVVGIPAFTKILGQGAIFAITPMTEQAARILADRLKAVPVILTGMPMRSVPSGAIGYDDDDPDEPDDDDEEEEEDDDDLEPQDALSRLGMKAR